MPEHEAWLARLAGDPTWRGFAIETPDGRHVGNCGFRDIQPIPRKAELWIYIGDRSRQGRGLGQAAIAALLAFGFERMGLHRIWARVFAYNEARPACLRARRVRARGDLARRRLPRRTSPRHARAGHAAAVVTTRSVLLLGAGPLQVPIIEAARASAFAPSCSTPIPPPRVSPSPTSASSPTSKDAARALEIARRERASGVTSACTDYAVRTSPPSLPECTCPA